MPLQLGISLCSETVCKHMTDQNRASNSRFEVGSISVLPLCHSCTGRLQLRCLRSVASVAHTLASCTGPPAVITIPRPDMLASRSRRYAAAAHAPQRAGKSLCRPERLHEAGPGTPIPA